MEIDDLGAARQTPKFEGEIEAYITFVQEKKWLGAYHGNATNDLGRWQRVKVLPGKYGNIMTFRQSLSEHFRVFRYTADVRMVIAQDDQDVLASRHYDFEIMMTPTTITAMPAHRATETCSLRK